MERFEEMSPENIANDIGITLSDWPTHCTQVAVAMLRKGLARGYLANGQAAFATAFGHAFHSWIQLPDGRIADPLRYVYEGSEPYIWTGQPESAYEPQENVESTFDRLFRSSP